MIGAGREALLRKVVALGLLAVVVLGAGVLAVAPVVEYTVDAHYEVVAARQRLAALRSKREDLTALETVLKAEAARVAERPVVFEVPSSAVGWERLEAQLRNLASAYEAEVSGVRPLRLDEESGLKALRVEASLRAPRERLTDLIKGIEAAAPALFFEKIRLNAERANTAMGDDRVEIAATVRGFVVIAAPPATSVRR